MKRLRWLHLSDFHTGKDDYAQRRLFREILRHVEDRLANNAGPDFIFITGDLANRGDAKEYDEFISDFLAPLDGLLGGSVPIFTIPGNHDVDRAKARLVDSYSVRRRVPQFFDPTATGAAERANLVVRFRDFIDTDISTAPRNWMESDLGGYAEEVTVRDIRVGVAGLNTAWLSESDHDRHQLTPGLFIMEEALERIASTDIRIVLGHHPLDWYADDDASPIRSLLSKHGVIYLHGHLHQNRARVEIGAASTFLAVQAGAAFQARENEAWVNGFAWHVADLDRSVLEVEPRQWSREFREWRIDGTALPEAYRESDQAVWSLPLPTRESNLRSRRSTAGAAHVVPVPDIHPGWALIDSQFLNLRRQAIPEDEVIRFFDGRIPRWGLLLSGHIPVRQVVENIRDDVLSNSGHERASVSLITGAGGEGKSTALMQAAIIAVSEYGWNVLWRINESASLSPEIISQLARAERGWLIVSDDADTIASEVFQTATRLAALRRGDIHFLLAARDTDWHAAKGDQFTWDPFALHKSYVLRGLSERDAEIVVTAWERFGPPGLGRLYGLEHASAVLRLLAAAEAETDVREGAFLGAMLRSRFGDALKDHVRALLTRLAAREVLGTTLLDILVHIAAMHSEGVYILSKMVLAYHLNCDIPTLRRKVLVPLGEEAAATGAGQFILTRHRAVAEVTLDIAENVFGSDRDQALQNLAVAATRAAEEGHFVPELGRWYFLSSHFEKTGDLELAVRIAQAVLDASPRDPFLRVHLSSLLRNAGQPERAARLFRGQVEAVERNRRPLLYEWAIAEGSVGNDALNVLLAFASIADETERRPPDLRQALLSLSGIVISLRNMYELYGDVRFLEGAAAAAQLGTLVRPDPDARRLFNSAFEQARDAGIRMEAGVDAMSKMRTAAQVASEQIDAELPSWIASPDQLSTAGLQRLTESGRA
jgi:predicted MPP superfamily phosphohydrolase